MIDYVISTACCSRWSTCPTYCKTNPIQTEAVELLSPTSLDAPQMTRMLDILEDYCYMAEWNYCRIDGSTKGEDRDEAMEAFNAKVVAPSHPSPILGHTCSLARYLPLACALRRVRRSSYSCSRRAPAGSGLIWPPPIR